MHSHGGKEHTGHIPPPPPKPLPNALGPTRQLKAAVLREVRAVSTVTPAAAPAGRPQVPAPLCVTYAGRPVAEALRDRLGHGGTRGKVTRSQCLTLAS